MICTHEEPGAEDLFTISSVITFTPPEMPEPEAIPAGLENKIEIIPEAGSITLKGNFSSRQIEALENAFQTPAGKESIRQAIARMKTPKGRSKKTPSELGELFRVPLLAFRQGELWEPFEETHLLQGDWRLIDYPCELGENEFKSPERTAQGGRFLIKDETIKFEYFDNIEASLALFDFQEEWDRRQLVSWLEKNIPEESVLPDDKAAFLNKGITYLLDLRGFTLLELSYSKFRLRAALETKIKDAKRKAMKNIHTALLADRKSVV